MNADDGRERRDGKETVTKTRLCEFDTARKHDENGRAERKAERQNDRENAKGAKSRNGQRDRETERWRDCGRGPLGFG
jgi:hypothetical protein